MLKRIAILMLLATGPALAGSAGEAGRYVETDDYLVSAFASDVPAPQTLWVTGELRDAVEGILGHKFASLRVRYWHDDTRSAWILDEIGKELPITIGVTVENGSIDNVRVLEFRESRGWEVRYPFFHRSVCRRAPRQGSTPRSQDRWHYRRNAVGSRRDANRAGRAPDA